MSARGRLDEILNWEPYNQPTPEPPSNADMRHARATVDAHNGLPEVRPYRWQRAEQAREAEVAGRLEAIRAQLAEATERCPTCAYVICGCGWSS